MDGSSGPSHDYSYLRLYLCRDLLPGFVVRPNQAPLRLCDARMLRCGYRVRYPPQHTKCSRSNTLHGLVLHHRRRFHYPTSHHFLAQ
jgi:hypothetical protein